MLVSVYSIYLHISRDVSGFYIISKTADLIQAKDKFDLDPAFDLETSTDDKRAKELLTCNREYLLTLPSTQRGCQAGNRKEDEGREEKKRRFCLQ